MFIFDISMYIEMQKNEWMSMNTNEMTKKIMFKVDWAIIGGFKI